MLCNCSVQIDEGVNTHAELLPLPLPSFLASVFPKLSVCVGDAHVISQVGYWMMHASRKVNNHIFNNFNIKTTIQNLEFYKWVSVLSVLLIVSQMSNLILTIHILLKSQKTVKIRINTHKYNIMWHNTETSSEHKHLTTYSKRVSCW